MCSVLNFVAKNYSLQQVELIIGSEGKMKMYFHFNRVNRLYSI